MAYTTRKTLQKNKTLQKYYKKTKHYNIVPFIEIYTNPFIEIKTQFDRNVPVSFYFTKTIQPFQQLFHTLQLYQHSQKCLLLSKFSVTDTSKRSSGSDLMTRTGNAKSGPSPRTCLKLKMTMPSTRMSRKI